VKSSAGKCPNCSADLRKGKKAGSKGKRSSAKSKIVDKRGGKEDLLSLSAKKEEEYEEEKKPLQSKTAVLMLGIAGFIAFISGPLGLLIVNEDFLTAVWGGSDLIPLVNKILIVLFIYGMVISPVLFVSAYFTAKRKKWALCVLLALIGVSSIGQFALASIFALVALRFLVVARKEFEDFEELDS
jgi:hypothetical protein